MPTLNHSELPQAHECTRYLVWDEQGNYYIAIRCIDTYVFRGVWKACGRTKDYIRPYVPCFDMHITIQTYLGF